MIGEASHGTKQFYEWRQIISQKLISEHGFNFIAVEGDWTPCQRINRFVKGEEHKTSREILSLFNRWPTWMWANSEILNFIDWLKQLNESSIKNKKPVGFHGLDIYSLYESMDEVISNVTPIDLKLSQEIAKRYSCMASFRRDEIAYVKSLFKHPPGCKEEILEALNLTLKAKINNHEETWLDIIQSAQIVKNAEDYYRAMAFGDQDSWNVRDEHMMSTLQMLLKHYGPDSKTIVWAHNTHIGDYRATDMVNQGQVNIGGLAREIFGENNVGLVGFGTYSGSVIASTKWDGPTLEFYVPEAKPGSVEFECHNSISKINSQDFYLMFNNANHSSPLADVRGHRAVGVVYDPRIEQRGNYVPTSLSNRYDAFIFLNNTTGVTSLDVPYNRHKFPETYPHGNRI